MHDLPRAAAPPGVQHGVEERADPAVRPLQPDPVLRAGDALAGRRLAGLIVVKLPFDSPAKSDVVAYVDGGARGNPGPAGFGVRVEARDGTLIEEFGASIGVATNNIAEYRGLIAALTWARDHGCRDLLVRSDSLLLVQQMLGNYKVKSSGLQPLHAKARLLAGELDHVGFEHVRRESNVHADRLANAAMDSAGKSF
ncbi:MAG: reverse transcriptase-like protein [Luteitalea sp.]|nr:reverse transcriptase-like protein [Luteitalea sp.]